MTERRPARKRWTGAPRVASVARWPLKIRGALQAELQIPRALQIQSMSFVFSLFGASLVTEGQNVASGSFILV